MLIYIKILKSKKIYKKTNKVKTKINDVIILTINNLFLCLASFVFFRFDNFSSIDSRPFMPCIFELKSSISSSIASIDSLMLFNKINQINRKNRNDNDRIIKFLNIETPE